MNIIMISPENFEAFSPIIPAGAMEGNVVAVGCVEEDAILGCAVGQMDKDMFLLSWIYTVEGRRNEGIAAKMLEAMLKIKELNVKDAVFAVTYEDVIQSADIMNHMLLKAGFEVNAEITNSYLFSKSGVENASLMKRELPKNNIELEPLKEMGKVERVAYIEALVKNKLIAPTLGDMNEADQDKSMFFRVNNVVSGLMLIQELDEEGTYELSFLSIDNQKPHVSLSFVQACLKKILTFEDFNLLQFTCIDEKMEKIVKATFGEDVKPVVDRYIHAIYR